MPNAASELAPFQPAGIDHLVLRVKDAAVALAFYEGVLGCRLERRQPEIGLWQLRAGTSLLDLVELDGVGGPPRRRRARHRRPQSRPSRSRHPPVR